MSDQDQNAGAVLDPNVDLANATVTDLSGAAVSAEPGTLAGAPVDVALPAATGDVALGQTELAPAEHPVHSWLNVLVDEFKHLDEVALSRLHHIVSNIRDLL